jgi:hypothetical protein
MMDPTERAAMEAVQRLRALEAQETGHAMYIDFGTDHGSALHYWKQNGYTPGSKAARAMAANPGFSFDDVIKDYEIMGGFVARAGELVFAPTDAERYLRQLVDAELAVERFKKLFPEVEGWKLAFAVGGAK